MGVAGLQPAGNLLGTGVPTGSTEVRAGSGPCLRKQRCMGLGRELGDKMDKVNILHVHEVGGWLGGEERTGRDTPLMV